MAHAAYWASWADALHMIAGRLPEVANSVVDELNEVEDLEGCLAEVSAAADRLDRQGFVGRPSWADLKEGVRPPIPDSQEPGEWQHGWQRHASSASEYHFRETVMIAQSCAADQAHLRSHSGPGSGDVFHGSPTQVEFQLQPGIYRTLLLERLRLPLHITDARCECGARCDQAGRRSSICPIGSDAHREDPGEGVSRSRSSGTDQCEVA